MGRPSPLQNNPRRQTEEKSADRIQVTLNIRDNRNFPKVPSIRALERFLKRILMEEWGKSAEISFTVTNDREMAKLNERYLGRKGSTDVLSFPLTEKGEVPLRGEVVVSGETARRYARRLRQSHSRELLLYLIHGLLHLVGYDDRSERLRRRMKRRENEILRAFLGEEEIEGSGRKS